MREKMLALRNSITEWDTVNHIVAEFGKNGKRISDLYGPDIYANFFSAAAAIMPEALLYVNEGNVMTDGGSLEAYYTVIADLKKRGVPLHGAGFMCHFSETTLTPIDQIFSRLEKFAEFGIRLKATEFDITTENEEVQAAYLRDFMTIWFSHPATCGIVMWGFWERQHWRPSAALYRKNWEIKPAGQAWLDLVRSEWMTRTNGSTDASGIFALRGFLGEYDITARHAGTSKTIRVQIETGQNKIRIRL